MKSYKCPICYSTVSITRDKVHKRWVERGYDGDYMAHFCKCPICSQEVEIALSQLPLKVKLQLAKEWFTKK